MANGLALLLTLVLGVLYIWIFIITIRFMTAGRRFFQAFLDGELSMKYPGTKEGD